MSMYYYLCIIVSWYCLSVSICVVQISMYYYLSIIVSWDCLSVSVLYKYPCIIIYVLLSVDIVSSLPYTFQHYLIDFFSSFLSRCREAAQRWGSPTILEWWLWKFMWIKQWTFFFFWNFSLKFICTWLHSILYLQFK